MQPTKLHRVVAVAVLCALALAGRLALSGQSPQTAAQAAVEKLPLPPPEQPVPFNHKLHVGLGAQCLDCHAIKSPGFTAGYPPAATCMACHAAIKADSPHIQKLAEAEKSQTHVEWVKVYRVPDYVWFSHQTRCRRQSRLRNLPRPGRRARSDLQGKAHQHGLVHGLPRPARSPQRLRPLPQPGLS